MLSKLFSIVVLIAAVSAARTTKTKKNTRGSWDPFKALEDAFAKEGYEPGEIKVIRQRLLHDPIQTKLWPFTDYGKELAMSTSNVNNNHAGEVMEAVSRAANNTEDLGEDVQA